MNIPTYHLHIRFTSHVADLFIIHLSTSLTLKSAAGDLDFQLQTSLNRYDWTTIETENSFRSQNITFDGPYDTNVANRYVRLYFTNGYTEVRVCCMYVIVMMIHIFEYNSIVTLHSSPFVLLCIRSVHPQVLKTLIWRTIKNHQELTIL